MYIGRTGLIETLIQETQRVTLEPSEYQNREKLMKGNIWAIQSVTCAMETRNFCVGSGIPHK